MTISVPLEIVFYAEADDVPARLLCWIPSSFYGRLAEEDILDALRRFHPVGIELEANDEAFAEVGLRPPIPFGDARAGYVRAVEGGNAPDGMVRLQDLSSGMSQDARERIEEWARNLLPRGFARPGEERSSHHRGARLAMSAGEPAETVFRRLALSREE